MSKLINVGVSNRHIHLTEETYNLLFSTPLTKKSDLHQEGEFASNQVVTIKTPTNSFENVRILGPFRSYNQVEISASDAHFLGLNPPVRSSGDLKNSETITIIGPNTSITLKNACIIANRHVHLNPKLAKKLQVTNNQLVKIAVKGPKSCLLDAYTKISDNGYFELHIDYDDANACGLKNGDEVEIII